MKHITLFLSALLLTPLNAIHAAETTSTRPDRALPPSLQAEKPGGGGFDDALVTMATILEAQPGQAAVQRWPLSHKGSVRLVGWLQKLSSETDALLEVLVDGKTIWSLKLDAAEGLRHGFDLVAYDLSAKSTVDLRVASGAKPVRVSVAVQIVPEPFVSRWAAELPTGYPTWNEVEKVVLRKKGQEILQTIKEASKEKRGKVVIPPGDYLFHARWSQASTLSDLRDLELVAEGVTFWFEPPMIHALHFEKCRNVTVRGLTIDFTQPCWFQARVIEVDHQAKTLRAAVMPGYEPSNANGEPETAGNRALMFYDAQGRFINHRHSPGNWELADKGGSVLCSKIERSGIPAALKAGDYVVGTIRTGAALRSRACEKMRFVDVQVWSSPGVAVYEGGGAGGNVYRRVRATRRPHTNRLQAFGADVFHLAGADRGPTLDRCESAYSADDNLNIHGSFGRVIEKTAERRYYLEGAYKVGDAIAFWDQKSIALLGTAKVVSVQATPEGPSLAINEKYRAKGEFLVELDRSLELPPLALVVLDGKRSAGGFVLRNCWLHDNFQRTLINGSPDGLIENNTLQNVGQGLTIQFETWGPWMEGPFARNLVIRNNRFLDSPPDAAMLTVSMQPAGGGSNRRRFHAQPVTNMSIIGNYFGPTTGTPLDIHNVDGLKIHGNSIDCPASAPIPGGLDNSSTANWLYLQDCNAVSLQDNLTPKGK